MLEIVISLVAAMARKFMQGSPRGSVPVTCVSFAKLVAVQDLWLTQGWTALCAALTDSERNQISTNASCCQSYSKGYAPDYH
jgi:hypothetical protein